MTAPEKCPTCGSIGRGYRATKHGLLCTDAWHDTPSEQEKLWDTLAYTLGVLANETNLREPNLDSLHKLSTEAEDEFAALRQSLAPTSAPRVVLRRQLRKAGATGGQHG